MLLISVTCIVAWMAGLFVETGWLNPCTDPGSLNPNHKAWEVNPNFEAGR